MSQEKADELMRRAMEKAAEMARIHSEHARRWPTAANRYAASQAAEGERNADA